MIETRTIPERGCYSADQVLAGWRAQCRKIAIGPREAASNGKPHAYPTQPATPEPEALDVQYLMWIRVERFLDRRMFRSLRPLLQNRLPCAEFELWYSANPLLIVRVSSDVGVAEQPTLVPYPLREAVDRWNSREKRQVTYSGAHKASNEGRLVTWRPEGRFTTTLMEIARWQDSEWGS